MLTLVCQSCGKTFSEYASRVALGRGLYCSRACQWAAARARPNTAVCERCGETFTDKPHRVERGLARYCGHHCAQLARRPSLEAYFWAHVERSDGCWLWTGPVNTSNGYGRFIHERIPYYAHRLSYALAYGQITDDLNVLHDCDTPPCVRPDHLRLGTQVTNNEDRDAKDRVRHGERHPAAKVSQAQVDAIRATYATENVSQRALAQHYGISPRSISDILLNKSWRRPE